MKTKQTFFSNFATSKLRRPGLIAKTFASWLWKFYRFFLLFGLSIIVLYPLLYAISVALRTPEQLFDPLVILIPRHVTLDYIMAAAKYMDYPKALLNSLVIDGVSTLLQVISCTLVGYGLARYKFKGRGLVFVLVILTIIVPPQTIIMPNYLGYRYFNPLGIFSAWNAITGQHVSVNLINTYWSLFLPAMFGIGIRAGLFIFIFRQFFRGMPNDLEEAAYIDGCGQLRTFIQIMIPNAAPAFVTTILFSIVWYWNDFVYKSVFMSNIKTVMAQLYSLTTKIGGILQYDLNTNPYVGIIYLQAGVLLAILPLLIMYIFLQKYFTESISRTGIVG